MHPPTETEPEKNHTSNKDEHGRNNLVNANIQIALINIIDDLWLPFNIAKTTPCVIKNTNSTDHPYGRNIYNPTTVNEPY